MLEAKSITVRYGARVAASGVSLTLQPGTVTAIIGANGAGKSTVLRTLNGGLTPAEGQVILDNRPLQSYPRRAIARRIAVVAQEADVRFPVTVFEFLLGGRYSWSNTAGLGWESPHDIEVVGKVLRETELDGLANRLLDELSGGERQRAVLARALATEANILLLDEPTANLDLAHQAMLLAVVRGRCKQHGASALVVTHDVNLAAEFADQVLLMKNGATIAAGKPEEVLTPELLHEVFAVKVLVDVHPVSGVPRVTSIHEGLR
jgi:iron complex transport system ATP-binding protein